MGKGGAMASKTVQERHTPPRAAIYVRVSSLQQSTDGTSLATQEAACRAYAIEQGYTVAEELVFSEVHTGSEMWERPQLTALRDAIRDGRVRPSSPTPWTVSAAHRRMSPSWMTSASGPGWRCAS